MANTEEAANTQAELQKLKEALPDDEKNGNLGKIITYILDLMQTGWSFKAVLQNLGELDTLGKHLQKVEGLLENVTRDGKETILQVLDYLKNNCTEEMIAYCFNKGLSVMELYEKIGQDKITKHERTKDMILDPMKSFQQQKSDEMISNMAQGSAVVMFLQLLKIKLAWNRISAASNVIENRSEFDAIQKNLEKMEAMVTEFLDLCKRKSNDRSVNRKMMKINTLYTSTLGKISNLRVQINGHIQCLDLQTEYAAVDGTVNLVTAFTQAFQMLLTWTNLSAITKVVGVTSAVVFTGLSLAHYKIHKLSQDALKDLRKELNEVNRLRHKLQDLHDQAAQVVEEMED